MAKPSRWSVRSGWCTRDWIGGASYGPYSLKRVIRTAWITRKSAPANRQAPQWSLILSAPDPKEWRDQYVLVVDFVSFDLILEFWPGYRANSSDCVIRYLHANPKNWRQSNWFKEKK